MFILKDIQVNILAEDTRENLRGGEWAPCFWFVLYLAVSQAHSARWACCIELLQEQRHYILTLHLSEILSLLFLLVFVLIPVFKQHMLEGSTTLSKRKCYTTSTLLLWFNQYCLLRPGSRCSYPGIDMLVLYNPFLYDKGNKLYGIRCFLEVHLLLCHMSF